MTPKNTTRLPELPVRQCLPALQGALRVGHAVLSAEPGSGKTTLVPLLLLEEDWLADRKILILEPRRPAARMAARRMAELLGEAVGERVGYQVRFDRKVSPRTRIEVLTEGLLVRRIQRDPELKGVGLVILDEFHERNLQTDLALALCLDVAEGLRDDLRLLVMSASLDAAPLLQLLPATEVSAGGRPYEVTIQQAAADAELRDPVPACMPLLRAALAESRGDVLVFLPGRREIERMQTAVPESAWGGAVTVLPLYGDLSAEAQDRVLRGGGQGPRRVILATDIAESSLTIDGVSAVVDSGLARKPVFDPNTGLTRLETGWISKASALQRAGRAGRLGPGRCYRAWNMARQERLEDWRPAEIMTADLAALVLELANWGVSETSALKWLDEPPAAHWNQARTLLQQLGAVDSGGAITALGRRMTAYPTHPRLAHLLAATSHGDDRQLAADVAALLSERDPADRAIQGADVESRLAMLKAFRDRPRRSSEGNRAALRRIDQAATQFRRLRAGPGDGDRDRLSPLTAAECVALAYPDRIAHCSAAGGGRFLMRNGRAALLDEDDALRRHTWLAVASVDAGRRDGRIRLAAAITEAQVQCLFGGAIREERSVRWDGERRDVVARRGRWLDAILLSEEAVPLETTDATDTIIMAEIRRQGLAAFFDDPVTLRARIELMRRLEPQAGWPDCSEAGLLATLEEWLLPWLRPGEGVRQLKALRLDELIRAMLGWESGSRLDAQLPAAMETAAGTRRKISYAFDGSPTLDVPLQEMLGEAAGPRLADGRVAVVLQLLSPAGRPLQRTSDLAGFWAGAYESVKKEMRGRYPKHYWPDDPLQAKATRFTKRRMGEG